MQRGAGKEAGRSPDLSLYWRKSFMWQSYPLTDVGPCYGYDFKLWFLQSLRHSFSATEMRDLESVCRKCLQDAFELFELRWGPNQVGWTSYDGRNVTGCGHLLPRGEGAVDNSVPF
jgi:hypothetical protein